MRDPSLPRSPRRIWPALPLTVLGTVLALAGGSSIVAAAQQVDPDLLSPLHYRHIGPPGNRLSAVTGVPGDPNVYYVGAASGGVWKTVDGGVNWEPVFDDQPSQSIGALELDPSNPNVVWAGTGESFIRSNVAHGDGIYRSPDGGETWEHMGLAESGRIARIIVHPHDPDTVLVAAVGHLYGPQEQRGVFRTTDGGDTWDRVLFVDENTGASDIVMDPNNPEILFAGMWQMQIWTWGRTSGGPGSGLWMSRDGGDAWVELTGEDRRPGLPVKPLGKIGLAMSADDSDRVYALIETDATGLLSDLEEHQGVLWRSDDGGDTWRMVNGDHALMQRPLYYTRATAAPDDADEIHFLSTRHSVSTDGGVTTGGGGAGGDNHDMWIDPLMPDRMVVGHDGGVSISTTRGETWFRPDLPIAQMYHVFVDDQVPYNVMGNRQDGPSARGPSHYLAGGSIPADAWHSVGGCESGFAIPDPVDNDIIWSGCYDSILERYDAATGRARNVSVWPDNPEGWAAEDVRFRFQWTFPIAISPHDHETVYVGSQVVHRTTNAGQSWEVISPDLTTDDPDLQQKTGGLTYEDTSPTYAAVLFAIAGSPLTEGEIWAGSNDGLLHVTRDDGATWENVTGNLPDLPERGTFSNIEPSRHRAGKTYVAVDMHQLGDFDPYLYVTEDHGASWRRIDAGIPRSVLSYTHVIREDPERPGMLYAGTGNGVWLSVDDGASWMPLQANLPHAPVHWLTVQDRFDDLVIGTYGRGFWIMDDITPLQQLTVEVQASPLHLFELRPAYRYLRRGGNMGPGSEAAGENPEYGATINYWVGAGSGGGARLEIVRDGEVIRELGGPARPGLNRVHWDLRYEGSRRPTLRSDPPQHSHYDLGEDGTRPAPDGGRVSPLAPPDDYTVRLTVGDRTLETALTVLPDPSSEGTPAEIEEQLEILLALRSMVNDAVDLLEEAERVREQLRGLDRHVRSVEDLGPADVQQIQERAEALSDRLVDLEMRFTDLRLNGGQDSLRYGRQLYAKMTSLAGYISGTDHRPTDQQVQVFEQYQEMLGTYEQQMEEIRASDVAELNRLLREKGLGTVITGRTGG